MTHAKLRTLVELNVALQRFEVAASIALDPGAGIEVDPLGEIEIRGLEEPVELAALRRSAPIEM